MRKCHVVELDTVPYLQGLEVQKKVFDKVKNDGLSGVFIMLRHHPVVTVGRAGGWENMLIPREEFTRRGIEVYETNRGGNITYHGPGQLVGYPVLNLNHWQKDVHWYVRNIEQVIINTLKGYGVEAGRKPEYTGVWVGDKKITAIGISVKNWITMHGFAFQVKAQDIHNFTLINPCGITEFGVVALDELAGGIDFPDVAAAVKKNFSEVFDCELIMDDIT
ncbi:MAG TPA: lipoyl(octanoyl) transferase LipB [Bacillota bacterium]|nr:lipoyl(octanoyl) transferase LipB [Bacillota bacterium]